MRYSPYDEFITFGTVPAALRLLYNPHANQAGIQDQINVSELLASDPSFSVNSDGADHSRLILTNSEICSSAAITAANLLFDIFLGSTSNSQIQEHPGSS